MRFLAARDASLRLRRTLPLLLVLLLPAGLAESHGFHGAGSGQSTIYADARHAGQADHWEAAETIVTRRCPDCLAPAKHRGLAPIRAGGASPPVAVATASAPGSEPLRPSTRRAGGPRAPPLS